MIPRATLAGAGVTPGPGPAAATTAFHWLRNRTVFAYETEAAQEALSPEVRRLVASSLQLHSNMHPASHGAGPISGAGGSAAAPTPTRRQ